MKITDICGQIRTDVDKYQRKKFCSTVQKHLLQYRTEELAPCPPAPPTSGNENPFKTKCLIFLKPPSSLSTDNVYRKCLANGTWAQKGNYSMCHAIIEEVSVCGAVKYL